MKKLESFNDGPCFNQLHEVSHYQRNVNGAADNKCRGLFVLLQHHLGTAQYMSNCLYSSMVLQLSILITINYSAWEIGN